MSSHTWHRAEVRSIKVILDGTYRPELIDVYYIDAGVSDYVKFKNLRRLVSQFCELPMQAIECSLCDIVPGEEKQDWSDEALQFFESLIFDKSSYMLELVAEDKLPLVRLVDKSSLESVSQLMIEKGYARLKSTTSNQNIGKTALENSNNEKVPYSSSSSSEPNDF